MGNELESFCLCFAIWFWASYSSSALVIKWTFVFPCCRYKPIFSLLKWWLYACWLHVYSSECLPGLVSVSVSKLPWSYPLKYLSKPFYKQRPYWEIFNISRVSRLSIKIRVCKSIFGRVTDYILFNVRLDL